MADSFLEGWLLDIYEDPDDGVAVWLLGEDGSRLHLRHDFPVTFYAAGPAPRLRQLWRFLEEQPLPVELERQERRDLFSAQPVVVLACRVRNAAEQPRLFRQAADRFPELTYYDADLSISLRYAAAYNVFPLARCRIETDSRDNIQSIQALDSPWDLAPCSAPLRTLALEPDQNPAHTPPACLAIRLNADRVAYRLPLLPERPLLVNLRAILRRHDPDLLLTTYGDTWLLPHLHKLSQRWKIPLPFSRHPGRSLARRPERTYFSYGRIVHHGPQYRTFGRWHVDCCNAMLYHDYGMEGVLELARVTALPVQTVARTSPGTGISSMQILTALRNQVLVPWRKQQAERPKSVMDLLRADQGGLVYQPTVGLHTHVAEVDFVSMYPSIMAHFNISPETVGNFGRGAGPVESATQQENFTYIPQLGVPIDLGRRGLVPETLDPLLQKRLKLKAALADLPAWHPLRKPYTAWASAHKWLLVTCFGYLGYKNARFGRIEAHEAVTAYGREILLCAKEAAEDLGYTVLHLYVDGMWVQKEGQALPQDFQPLLDEIVARTGLPIALDGVYRWVAFLPSRVDARVPVANRYFGCFQDGSLKLRGIEARREDTAPFIAGVQKQILELLARVPDPGPAEDPGEAPLEQALPAIYALLRRTIRQLRAGRIPAKEMLISQKLSRALEEYRTPSPSARAAAQLAEIGKHLRAGQRVRFHFTLGDPGVRAWDLPGRPDPAAFDVARYIELLLRAASSVLQPLGVSEAALRDRLFYDAEALPLLPARPPLFPWPVVRHLPSPALIPA